MEIFAVLKGDSPELFSGARQLQAELPASPSFVTPPDQNRIHRVFVHQIDQPELLPDGKVALKTLDQGKAVSVQP